MDASMTSGKKGILGSTQVAPATTPKDTYLPYLMENNAIISLLSSTLQSLMFYSFSFLTYFLMFVCYIQRYPLSSPCV